MSDVETALVLRMEATLAKFEKQMAKARKVGNDTATGLERQFARSNKQMAVSAEQSALAMGREMDRLRAKYDPLFAASQRYERALEELNQAHRAGALTAGQFEGALERLNMEYTNVATGAGRAGAAMGRMSSFGGAGAIQNMSYQVADFAVQVSAGTRASQAFGQQLPQMLGGLGAFGAVAGAAVAVGIPLVAMLVDAGSASERLEEQLKELQSAVSDYETAVRNAVIPTDELREKYGTATEAARQFLAVLLEKNQVEALNAVQAAVDTLTTQFGGLSETLINVGGVMPMREIEITARDMAEQFGITNDEALNLAEGLRAVSEAPDVRAQADAAAELLDLMKAVLGPMEQMPLEAQAVVDALAQAGLAASEIQGHVDRTTLSVQDMVTALGNAADGLSVLIGQASSLGDNMYRAASAAWEFLRAKGASAVQGGRGGDPRAMGGSVADWNDPENRLIVNPGTTPTIRSPRRGSRGGGGGGRRGHGGQKREKESLFDLGQKELQNLERQIELIGKTDAQVAELTARYKLLDEAKKRGIDLDSRQAGSTRTVREQIDEQAAAIGRLTEKADQYKERAAFMDQLNQDLKDGFIDAIVEGENFGDVLANVAKQLAKAALQAALFNEGRFARGSGKGLLGGLFDGLFAGLKGKRAAGGPVQAGQPYLVNERTPNSEVFIPSQSGAVLNVGQAQAALRRQSGGGAGDTVHIRFAPQIDARGADAGAVQRLELALARANAEFEARAVNAYNMGKKRRQII